MFQFPYSHTILMVCSQGEPHWKCKWSPNYHETSPLQNDGLLFSLTSPFRPSSSLAFTALNDSSILFSFFLCLFVCKSCFFHRDNQWLLHSSLLSVFPNPSGFFSLLLFIYYYYFKHIKQANTTMREVFVAVLPSKSYRV